MKERKKDEKEKSFEWRIFGIVGGKEVNFFLILTLSNAMFVLWQFVAFAIAVATIQKVSWNF